MSVAEKDRNPHDRDVDVKRTMTYHLSKNGGVVEELEIFEADEYDEYIRNIENNPYFPHARPTPMSSSLKFITEEDVSDISLDWEMRRKNAETDLVSGILHSEKTIEVKLRKSDEEILNDGIVVRVNPYLD